MKTMIKNRLYGGWMLFMLCAILSACTKYDTPASIAGGIDATDSVKLSVKRYVLWVNIDGAAGSLVKQEVEKGDMPTLKSMLANSKYMWSGIADDHSIDGESKPEGRTEEDPVTWTSMLTGVSSNLHRVNSNSYTPEFDVDNNSASYFPNVVQYLAQKDPSAQMSCVTPWEHLNKYLGGMQSVVTTNGDDETVSTLLDQLKNRDYRFTLTSFRGVQDAGKAGGFTLDNANYVSNLKKVDSALKQLLETINARPNAYYEDWLVCVTSDHGGTSKGAYGGSSEAERDIFGVFYYPHYTSLEMKGSTLEAVRISSDDWAFANDSLARYGFGRNNGFAIEMMMRNNAKSTGSYSGTNWTILMSKKNSWGIYRKNSNYVSRMEGTGTLEESISAYNDAMIHTAYTGFKPMAKDASDREYVLGYDGLTKVKAQASTVGISNDSSAILLGRGTGYDKPCQPLSTVFYLVAARIWNTQLNDVTMQETANLPEIPSNKSYRNNLIGEWRFSPDKVVNDTVVPNLVKGAPSFIFNRKPTFVKIANTLPGMLSNNQIMMENTLVLPQVIYWLLGSGGIDSRLEGYSFLPKFNLEEQWRDVDSTAVKK